jgi:alkylglycerol monooxygenase
MNLILLATPFFAIAILVELAYGLFRGRNTYRLNDSLSSLFLGVLSQARRFLTLGIGGYVYYLTTQYFSLELMDSSHWFTWVLAVLLYDFCYYWLHRMGHERIILWAAHVAHHQSEDYNLTTALRQTSTGFLFGWIFYIPMYLFGIPAEVIVTVGAINLLYQFWVHTEHIPKLGWYEWFFVTASNHRVHHAQNEIYLDRNYGGVLILWDRMFGTFQEELDEEPVVFGIRGAIKSWNPVKALTHIYVDMYQDSVHTKNWRDKLRVWLGRTGWRPTDIADRYPREKTDLDHFERFDPKVPAAVAWYAIFQLLAVLVLANHMQLAELNYWGGVALLGMLLATTVTTAYWLEARAPVAVVKWELLRLALVILLVGIGWQGAASASLLLSAIAYLLANALWLVFLTRSGDNDEGSNVTPAA